MCPIDLPNGGSSKLLKRILCLKFRWSTIGWSFHHGPMVGSSRFSGLWSSACYGAALICAAFVRPSCCSSCCRMAPKLGLKRSAQRISWENHRWSMDDPWSTEWFKGKPTGNHDLPIVLAIQDPWQTKTGKEEGNRLGWRMKLSHGPHRVFWSSRWLQGWVPAQQWWAQDSPGSFLPAFLSGKVSDLTFQTFQKFQAILSHLVILQPLKHPLRGYGLVPSQVWVPKQALGAAQTLGVDPGKKKLLAPALTGVGVLQSRIVSHKPTENRWEMLDILEAIIYFPFEWLLSQQSIAVLTNLGNTFLSRALCTINSSLVLVLGLGTCGPMGTAAKALQLTMRPCGDVASAGGGDPWKPHRYIKVIQ